MQIIGVEPSESSILSGGKPGTKSQKGIKPYDSKLYEKVNTFAWSIGFPFHVRSCLPELR